MQKNFEAALSNIEKADDIADRTDALASKAKMFHDLGKQVHYNERCKNYKMYAIVGGIVVVLLIIIIVVATR